MTPETLFFLTMIVTASPDEASVQLFAFDSYLKCVAFEQGLKSSAMFMHPEVDIVCRQQGLPDVVEPE